MPLYRRNLTTARSSRRVWRQRSSVERLEDRRVLATWVVNTTSDFPDETALGDGIVDINSDLPGFQISLRGAIEEANATTGPDEIRFAIPTSDEGFVDRDGALGSPGSDLEPDVFEIQLVTDLPALTDTTAGTSILGLTQAEFTGDTNPFGPEIVLRPATSDGEPQSRATRGIAIVSNSNTIQGLVIQDFEGSGIVVQGNANVLRANYLGTSATGTASAANSIGAEIVGDANTVGGVAAADGNLISGNQFFGISLFGASNELTNNIIGASADRTTPLANGADGVRISGSRAANNRIGLGTDASANLIAFNQGNGVLILGQFDSAPQGNAIRGNSIVANLGLGIDLSNDSESADGRTANDSGDIDVGSNQLQNFPVILSATLAESLRIIGQYSGAPATTVDIDLFVNAIGGDEGERFIATTRITTSDLGTATFDVTAPCDCQLGEIVTATATDTRGNTSEFSDGRSVIEARSISGRLFEDHGGDGPTADDTPLSLSPPPIQLFADDGNGRFDGPNGDIPVDAVPQSAGNTFRYEQLPAQLYFLSFVESAEFDLTSGGNDPGSGPGVYRLDLTETVTASDVDYYLFYLTTLSGTVQQDLTGDGITPDDTPLENVTVEQWLDTNRDGILTDADERMSTTVSNAQGRFEFPNVGVGDYFIVAIGLTGEEQTVGGTAPGGAYQIHNLSRVDRDDLLFAYARFGGVAGLVWNDADNDRARDAGEVGLANVTVELRDAQGTTRQTTTNAEGRYSFARVLPGNYQVAILTSDNVEMTFPLARFDDQTFIPAGTIVGFATAADLTGDQRQDLVIVHDIESVTEPRGSIWVYANLGQESWSDPRVISLGDFVRAKSALPSDLDGDGDVDLLVTTIGSPERGVAGGLVWLRNNGAGDLETISIPSAPDTIDAAVGDFDGDGRADIAAIDFRRDTLAILLQTAPATFTPLTTLDVDRTPRTIAVSDMTGDGRADLVVGAYDANQVTIFSGDGTGHFTAHTRFSARQPSDVVVSDLNQDQLPDLIVAGANGVQLFAGTGRDAWTTVPENLTTERASAVAVGAINGDALLDVVAVHPVSSQVSVIFRDGTNTFAEPRLFATPNPVNQVTNRSAPLTVTLADLNQDAALDIVTGQLVGGAGILWNRIGQYSVDVVFNETAGPLDFGLSTITESQIPIPATGASVPLQAIDPIATDAAVAAMMAQVSQEEFPLAAEDVNGDGTVSPLDALLIVNRLNSDTSASLAAGRLDVSGDGVVSPLDSLLVINRLNDAAQLESNAHPSDVNASADAEGEASQSLAPRAADVGAALATTVRRRR